MPYTDGYRAGKTGRHPRDNPFSRHGDEGELHTQWRRAWQSGRRVYDSLMKITRELKERNRPAEVVNEE